MEAIGLGAMGLSPKIVTRKKTTRKTRTMTLRKKFSQKALLHGAKVYVKQLQLLK